MIQSGFILPITIKPPKGGFIIMSIINLESRYRYAMVYSGQL